MKILLVITKAEIGGAQTFLLTLARGLKKTGSQVSVASGDGGYLQKELETENINFFHLNNLRRSKNPLALFLFIFELKKIIDREEFDTIHLNSTNTLPAVFAAKLSKRKPKVIFTVHGLSVIDPAYKTFGLIKLIFIFYFRFFLYFVDKVVFVSKYNLFEAIKQRITNRGIVIYNGLDLASNYFLKNIEARKKIGELINRDLQGAYLIGSIGRLAPQKNYEFIIGTWPEIKKIKPSAKLVIIGEGPERIRYEKMINNLGLSEDIYLPGEREDASCLLKGLDLFVLPSIYEGLSVSLIEAVFSGIPILASNVGGNSEIIGIENCFTLDDEADFLAKLKQRHFCYMEKPFFTAADMVKKYKEIYE